MPLIGDYPNQWKSAFYVDMYYHQYWWSPTTHVPLKAKPKLIKYACRRMAISWGNPSSSSTRHNQTISKHADNTRWYFASMEDLETQSHNPTFYNSRRLRLCLVRLTKSQKCFFKRSFLREYVVWLAQLLYLLFNGESI